MSPHQLSDCSKGRPQESIPSLGSSCWEQEYDPGMRSGESCVHRENFSSLSGGLETIGAETLVGIKPFTEVKECHCPSS